MTIDNKSDQELDVLPNGKRRSTQDERARMYDTYCTVLRTRHGGEKMRPTPQAEAHQKQYVLYITSRPEVRTYILFTLYTMMMTKNATKMKWLNNILLFVLVPAAISFHFQQVPSKSNILFSSVSDDAFDDGCTFTSTDTKLWSRGKVLSTAAAVAASYLVSSATAACAVDDLVSSAEASSSSRSISACSKTSEASSSNCVSTASVRQIDLYMPPWKYPESINSDEAMARLKGAVSLDDKLSIVEQKGDYLLVRATRNFCIDELQFVIKPTDNIVTFRGQQVEGPNVNDFGANRKRLDELRQNSGGIFTSMGDEALGSPSSEGALGQLKSFYGYGQGFGDIRLGD